MDRLEFVLRSLEETSALGKVIGQAVIGGNIVYLDGDLGAGKTTLTKSLAEALGIPGQAVSSPTFSLVQEYVGGRLTLYHLDIYRLQTAAEVINLGIDDYFADNHAVIVIEWAKNAVDMLPTDALSIGLSARPNANEQRDVILMANGVESSALLYRIREALEC